MLWWWQQQHRRQQQLALAKHFVLTLFHVFARMALLTAGQNHHIGVVAAQAETKASPLLVVLFGSSSSWLWSVVSDFWRHTTDRQKIDEKQQK